MREILIATTNKGKYGEMMEVLSDLPFEFVFLGDLDFDASGFEEDGLTFAENAYKKAKYFGDKMEMLSLGEDSGIFVNVLADELGIKTRRWGAGESASDQEWIDYFMDRMKSEDERRASFVCSSCIVGDGIEEYFEGRTNGLITKELQAPLMHGLPLSSCFLADGSSKVYAALSPEEKNMISHRGSAMAKVKQFLESLA